DAAIFGCRAEVRLLVHQQSSLLRSETASLPSENCFRFIFSGHFHVFERIAEARVERRKKKKNGTLPPLPVDTPRFVGPAARNLRETTCRRPPGVPISRA